MAVNSMGTGTGPSRSKIKASYPVTTAASALLSALLAASPHTSGTIDKGLVSLTLIPRSGVTAYMQIGAAADTGSLLIPATGISFACDRTTANKIYLYGDGLVDVFQQGV